MNSPEVDRSRVVVVDDNVPSAQLVQALLGRAGLDSVAMVTDSRELLERFDELAPELVVLDLHMPRMDGYAVLGELRQRATPADLPVLVLTADTTREATHRALQLGANDFLTKPLDAAELVLRVRNLLRTRRLHVGLQHRHRWLEASALLSAELLSGNCTEPLHRVAELAGDAAAADLALVVVPRAGDARPLRTRVWVGDRSPELEDALTAAFAAGRLDPQFPAVLAGPDDRPGSRGEPAAVGPVLLVPLAGRDRLFGALLLARRPGRPPFPDGELTFVTGFADQASVAVELAEARSDQQRMLLLADRHRIARDLHDQVIQRLFATGLRLQQVADRAGPGPLADRLGEHVDDLDETINEIRSTIFGLRQGRTSGPGDLQARLQDLVDQLADVLGFQPQLWVDAPLDPLREDLAEDVLAAAREALTNVAKHAQARRAEVSVLLTDTEVVLEVQDDGVGVGSARRRSGITNLCERARRHGGRCRLSAPPAGGTRIEWRAPLADAPPEVSVTAC